MRKYFILFFVLLVTSCGFHPRGVMTDGNAGNFDSVSGTKFYIENNNFNDFANELRRTLTSYNAEIVTNDKDADYIINLQDVEKKSLLTSVVGGASNNTYQLIYSVDYNVVKPDDKTAVIPNKSLSAQQFWQSNTGTQLAQSNEADRIYTYLQSQLVNNMANQIAALLPSKETTNKKR